MYVFLFLYQPIHKFLILIILFYEKIVHWIDSSIDEYMIIVIYSGGSHIEHTVLYQE